MSGMTIIAELPHNLAVVFGHLEEVGNIHAAFITFFTTADRHDSVSNFLLTNDQEVRHLLQFALAVLVAELLTPTASAATLRSCQPASGLPRHSACTLLVAFIDFHADAGVHEFLLDLLSVVNELLTPSASALRFGHKIMQA